MKKEGYKKIVYAFCVKLIEIQVFPFTSPLLSLTFPLPPLYFPLLSLCFPFTSPLISLTFPLLPLYFPLLSLYFPFTFPYFPFTSPLLARPLSAPLPRPTPIGCHTGIDHCVIPHFPSQGNIVSYLIYFPKGI